MKTEGRFAARLRPDEAHLRLLATTDLHMNILSYDYRRDRPARMACLELVARAVTRLRAVSANVLLFDNGDFLQGGPMGDYFGLERPLAPDEPHPMIAAMNALDYDAGTLGNHEFNYGLEFLMRVLRDARFPHVSANLLRQAGPTAQQDKPLIAPYTILWRSILMPDGTSRTIRVGVFGLAPPQTVDWEREALAGRVCARDMVEAARRWVPEIRAAGADIVIALAHTGIEPDQAAAAPARQENAARALAKVPGIDALVLGHVHRVFPSPGYPEGPDLDSRAGTIAGTPAVMSGHSGGHLGVIDLRLRHCPETGWHVPGARARVLDLEPAGRRTGVAAPHHFYAGSEIVRRSAAAAHAETLGHIRHSVGATRLPIHSFFSMLGPTPALRLVAEAQRAWFQRQPQARDWAHLPVLSAVAPFNAGGFGRPGDHVDIKPGIVTRNHLHDLYPFPNKLAAVLMTGAEVTAWLHRVAALYDPLEPGAPARPLPSGNEACYNFDMIDGLEYEISLDGMPEVRGLRLSGRPLAADDRFVVVLNSYRASGGGGLLPPPAQDRRIPVPPIPARAALADHVAQAGCVGSLAGPGNWRLTAPAGSVAIYDTSADALPHLHEISAYAPEIICNPQPDLLQLRLRF